MLRPKSLKYNKLRKGRLKYKKVETKSINLQFGSYGLKATEIGRITARQIEATRITVSRKLKREGKVWIRVFPSIPVTSKPSEIRMGKGKGKVDFWTCRVYPGQILFEITGVSRDVAREALQIGSHKLPVLTKVIEL